MVDKEITYRCTICKTSYPTLEAAMKCEQQGVEKLDYKMFDKVRRIDDLPISSRRPGRAKTGYVLGYHISDHHVYISVGALVQSIRGQHIEKVDAGLVGFRQNELVPMQKP